MAIDEKAGGSSAHRTTGDLCARCTHFHVTWNRRHPYGCRAMGFQSRRRPWRVVLEASGRSCRLFREKTVLRAYCPK